MLPSMFAPGDGTLLRRYPELHGDDAASAACLLSRTRRR
jgi:hypothetical protein